MAICGPKLAVCGMVLGVWGVVMLALMGIFLKVGSPAFADDLPIDEEEWASQKFSMGYIDGLYDQAAYNCWVAAALYIGVFAFSFFQHKINARSNYIMS